VLTNTKSSTAPSTRRTTLFMERLLGKPTVATTATLHPGLNLPDHVCVTILNVTTTRSRVTLLELTSCNGLTG
jgi:hypothetical protein